MTDKNTQMLKQAIRDYLQWMRSLETRGSKKLMHFGLLLVDFIDFVKEKNVVWEDMFTFDTLKGFRKYTSTNNPSDTITGLSLYLFENGRIPQPLPNPCYHPYPYQNLCHGSSCLLYGSSPWADRQDQTR